MLKLYQNIESFMSFCSNFLLAAFGFFGLDSDGFRRRNVMETWSLIRIAICILFTHLLNLFHDLISFLLEKSNASRFILNGLLKLFDLFTQTLILGK